MKLEPTRENVHEAIEEILDYLWLDEQKHAKQSFDAGYHGSHIFRACELVRYWLDHQEEYEQSCRQLRRQLMLFICLCATSCFFLPELLAFFGVTRW